MTKPAWPACTWQKARIYLTKWPTLCFSGMWLGQKVVWCVKIGDSQRWKKSVGSRNFERHTQIQYVHTKGRRKSSGLSRKQVGTDIKTDRQWKWHGPPHIYRLIIKSEIQWTFLSTGSNTQSEWKKKASVIDEASAPGAVPESTVWSEYTYMFRVKPELSLFSNVSSNWKCAFAWFWVDRFVDWVDTVDRYFRFNLGVG